MSTEKVAAVVERFGIPSGHENFLFTLPAFYVAKADGSVSMKEAMSIIYNSLRKGLIREQERDAFSEFAKSQMFRFMEKASLEDLDLVTEALSTKLQEYPGEEADKIRAMVRETCEKVAKSSGPLFREKILPEERRMLDRILAGIHSEEAWL